MKRAVKLRINGTVQGVFFRDFIKEEADNLGIKGFVRNMDDGTVEVFAEGNPDEVRQMIEVCKTGPPHSMIKKVEVIESKFEGFEDFRVVKI